MKWLGKLFVLLLALILSVSMLSSCSPLLNALQNIGTASNAPEEAYADIKLADELVSVCMNSIYDTWYFGIHDAPDCTTDTVYDRLSNASGFDVDDLKTYGGYTAEELIDGTSGTAGWQVCLWSVQNCMEELGYYQLADESLGTAKEAIKSMSGREESYDDLREYYNAVYAYNAFFQDLNCSFNDLKEQMPRYEAEIREAKADLEWEFE